MLKPANPEPVEWVSREGEDITETDKEDMYGKNKIVWLAPKFILGLVDNKHTHHSAASAALITLHPKHHTPTLFSETTEAVFRSSFSSFITTINCGASSILLLNLCITKEKF